MENSHYHSNETPKERETIDNIILGAAERHAKNLVYWGIDMSPDFSRNHSIKEEMKMGHNFLAVGDVDCEYESNCTRRSFDYCTRCKNNKIAVEKLQKEKEKKNYFKRLL